MTATVRQFMTDPGLLGGTFGGDSFAPWRALLAGFDGLPLSEAEAETFRALTGREPPGEALEELWCIAGRRGAKSLMAALKATTAAVLFDGQARLAPGEVASVFALAKDRGQARTVFRYIRGLIAACPMLEAMVANETAERIELNNRTAIEVGTASFRSARSYTFRAVVADELAFWHDDGANPAEEILAAVRPGLATLGGRLFVISSPYARRGPLWEAWRRHYGRDGPVLVVKAPTRALNPTFPQHVIDRALEQDEARARAEYLGEFRRDVETLIPLEVVEAAVVEGRRELPPVARGCAPVLGPPRAPRRRRDLPPDPPGPARGRGRFRGGRLMPAMTDCARRRVRTAGCRCAFCRDGGTIRAGGGLRVPLTLMDHAATAASKEIPTMTTAPTLTREQRRHVEINTAKALMLDSPSPAFLDGLAAGQRALGGRPGLDAAQARRQAAYDAHADRLAGRDGGEGGYENYVARLADAWRVA